MSDARSSGQDARDPALSSLYQAGEQLEPPPHLDDGIMVAARRELRTGPRRHTPLASAPWIMPLSTAAVLVLSVSVIVLMRYEAPEQFEPDRAGRVHVPTEEQPAPAAEEAGPAAKSESAAPSVTIRLKEISPHAERQKQREDEFKVGEVEKAAEDSRPQALMLEPGEAEARRRAELETRRVEEERKRSADSVPGSIAASEPVPESAVAAEPPDFAGVTARSRESFVAPPDMPPLPEKIYGTADEWLKDIAKFRHSGEAERAAAELKRFKVKYPDLTDQDIEAKIAEFKQ